MNSDFVYITVMANTKIHSKFLIHCKSLKDEFRLYIYIYMIAWSPKLEHMNSGLYAYIYIYIYIYIALRDYQNWKSSCDACARTHSCFFLCKFCMYVGWCICIYAHMHTHATNMCKLRVMLKHVLVLHVYTFTFILVHLNITLWHHRTNGQIHT